MTLRFYRRVSETAKRVFKDKDIQGLIIGGPGPTKEKFLRKASIPKYEDKVLKVVSTNYTGKPGLKEALHKAEDVLGKEEIIKEKRQLENFFTTMKKEPKLVTHNKEEIKEAVEYGAVEKLFLSERLSNKEIKEMVEDAEEQGSEVFLISDETEEGTEFYKLGGYGVILRFPI